MELADGVAKTQTPRPTLLTRTFVVDGGGGAVAVAVAVEVVLVLVARAYSKCLARS